jgi:signal transduction histidine kinase
MPEGRRWYKLKIMYRKKLVLAFFALLGLMLIQILVAYWLVQTAQRHEKRSSVAHDMLTRYTDISADKQRLKVWYAQLLLTGEASAESRDTFLQRINANILALRELSALQARLLDAEALPMTGGEASKTLDILELNFSNFRQRVIQTRSGRHSEDREQIWTEVLGIFDMAGALDVRIVLAEAIKRQSLISQLAGEAADAAIHRSNWVMGIMIVLTVMVTFAMSRYLVQQIKRPVEDLLLGTLRMQAGNFDPDQPIRVPERKQDEFGQLAHSFNAMAQEIHQTRLRDKEKNDYLEAAVQERTAQLQQANASLQLVARRQRQLFADLSHELRTPATAILGEAEIALRGQDKQANDYRLSLTHIVETSRQLAQRINELLLLAREQLVADDIRLAEVPLVPLLQEAVGQARSIARDSGVTVVALVGSTPALESRIMTDAAKLHQILMVLYDNAVRYTPAGGDVQTHVNMTDDGFEISITDTGIGLLETEQAEVFARHFRGEQARRMRSDGAGLGLAIAKTLADALGVGLRLHGVATGGCRAVLTIPGSV